MDLYSPEEMKFRRTFLFGTVGLMLLLGVLFLSNPGIDLAISSLAREACPVPPRSPGSAWCPTAAIAVVREVFIGIFLLVVAVTLIASLRVLLAARAWIGLTQARCAFMIAVLVVGPGVVANLILKDNMGRARPRDVIELGGTKVFTPPLVPASECARNCSFVSGEASSMFAVFFALALLFPAHRVPLFVTGLATGLLAGAVRIVQGAHFLSDVLYAGLFMALTASLLHMAFIGLPFDPRRTGRGFAAPLMALRRLAMERLR